MQQAMPKPATYLNTVPGDSSPHHLRATHSLEAGGPILYSHIMTDTHTLTYALRGPWTRGGREVCTVVSRCLLAAVFQGPHS